MLRFFSLALLSLLFSSCLSDPDCVITASSEVKIDFLKKTPDSVRTELRDTLILDSIRVSGTNAVFYVADTVSSVALPIDVGAYETTLFFYYASQQDSIKLAYTRTTKVISPACGAFNHFQDLALILFTFPEVILVSSELSTSIDTNVKIKR